MSVVSSCGCGLLTISERSKLGSYAAMYRTMLKLAEYVARIEKMEFLCASSWRIASVNKAVASTWCGTFPRLCSGMLHVHERQNECGVQLWMWIANDIGKVEM
jgi:hypothetical protein